MAILHKWAILSYVIMSIYMGYDRTDITTVRLINIHEVFATAAALLDISKHK